MAYLQDNHIKQIANHLNISYKSVSNTLDLLNGGATIPFISRYRKELTGSLDELQIEAIQKRANLHIELEKRRESILENIEKQGKLTDELKKSILNAEDIPELEDLYLPYKQKRKTRAVKAREFGLQPLAEIIKLQQNNDIKSSAKRFLNKDVKTIEDALQGARDIIAEEISEDIKVRNLVRYTFEKEAVIKSKVIKSKKEEAEKYQDYFDFQESLKRIASHRLLAIRRGENEGFLRVKIEPDNEDVIFKIEHRYVKGRNACSEQMELAVNDSYKRLIFPSIETEFKNLSKTVADKISIQVFAENLRQLLLAPPLGEKRILAVDPGYRTGCKVVCLDRQGNLLHNTTIYPNPPKSETLLAAKTITRLTEVYDIEAIAVGNGTASRETVEFLRTKVKYKRDMTVFVVSEDGASIYSASAAAREEFPDYDVTVRGAISIGRRLADPLSELVKIDPKSLGIGQYQHDVDQKALQESLNREVESCVNLVGADLNTASKHLLVYVSGLGTKLAQNIIDYRTEHGAFKSRAELKKVKMLGAKAYEQAAGFLRIRNAKNPLDNTAVHPEAYPIVTKMAKDLGVSIDDLIKDADIRKKIRLENYVNSKTGMPTLKDIMSELEKPGRDPRPKIKPFEFSKDITTITDLREGMILPGIVTNITNFGAFVDVGIKEDGLLHISQIKKGFVENPADELKLHQYVTVKILSVDVPRKRISLTMIDVEN